MEGDIENKEQTFKINYLFDSIKYKYSNEQIYIWDFDYTFENDGNKNIDEYYEEHEDIPYIKYIKELDDIRFKKYIKEQDENRYKIYINRQEENQYKKFDNEQEDIEFCNNDVMFNQFSDTIVISILKTKNTFVLDLLLLISHLCVTAINEGFFLRGAVVCDNLYHSEEKIFGPALNKAYILEKEYAIYPRIILDDKIIEYLSEILNKRYTKRLLKRDDDDYYYVNYFENVFDYDYIDLFTINNDPLEIYRFLYNLKFYIEKLKSKTINNYNLKQKYLWLKKKYNMFITKYKYRKKNNSLNYYLKNMKLIK